MLLCTSSAWWPLVANQTITPQLSCKPRHPWKLLFLVIYAFIAGIDLLTTVQTLNSLSPGLESSTPASAAIFSIPWVVLFNTVTP